MTHVHAHAGSELEPVDVEELPAAVRERVDEHVEDTDAYEVEVRHFGGEVFEIINRFAPDA